MWISTESANLDGLERRFGAGRALAKLAAIRWAFSALPGLTGTLLEISAAGFARAPIPRFSSPHVREIAPALNDDLLDLYGRTGQTLGNRFTFFDSSQTFDAGIDWEPRQSAGWRAELHSFDYALELAVTFRISREEKYARHLRYLIADWIAANPPAAGTGWQAWVLARRVRNWMLAADSARSNWEGDAQFRDLVAKSLALQLAFLLSQLDSLPAARLDASRALLCAGRFFAGSKAREARDAGLDLLRSALAGARAEPWPNACLERARALAEWALLSTPSADSAWLQGELRASLDELESLLMPNGALPLLGPKARLNHDDLSDLAALAAVLLDSPEWKCHAGRFGILPHLWLGEDGKRRYESLQELACPPRDHADAASEILRLVGSQDSVLMVAAHLPQSAEEHQDFSSYELTLNDHRVVVDSGGFSPEESAYFPSARAHNLLLVDGRNPQWQGATASPDVELEFPGDCARLLLGDPGFLHLGIQHRRAWFRLRNHDWLILDWLEGQGVHRCTSLMHFYPTFEIITGEHRILARSRGRSIEVIPVGGARPQASVSRGDDAQFPGWYSPEFGIKFASAVLILDWAEVELPWVGGALITTEANQPIRQANVIPRQGSMSLEIGGRTFDCRMK